MGGLGFFGDVRKGDTVQWEYGTMGIRYNGNKVQWHLYGCYAFFLVAVKEKRC